MRRGSRHRAIGAAVMLVAASFGAACASSRSTAVDRMVADLSQSGSP